jgi:hypothetical protein
MTLNELQKLIKEEFDALTQEAEDDVDVSVDSDEIEAEKDPEETLRGIYDQLKTYFEGEEDMEMGDEEMPADDVEGEEPEADLAENQTEEAKYQKTGYAAGGKKSEGPNVGYETAKTTKGDGKLHESKSALQERFQKLANIIK